MNSFTNCPAHLIRPSGCHLVNCRSRQIFMVFQARTDRPPHRTSHKHSTKPNSHHNFLAGTQHPGTIEEMNLPYQTDDLKHNSKKTMSNNNNNNNSSNTAGLDALAALYNSIGASAGQDMRHPGVAAQALASLASQPTSIQGPAAAAGSTTSPSPYGLQSLYAQQVQQLTAPQQQQMQQAQNQSLLKSLPTELLQAYLASTAPQALPPSLMNNARQAAQLQPPQQQQNLNSQVQALATQLLGAQSNTNQKHGSVSNDFASILQGDLMETLARAGSTAAWGKASDTGLLNQLQGELFVLLKDHCVIRLLRLNLSN